ncbi:MAG: hypothetical protein IJM22_03880 [Treponema sp.]|nr:hypothetical protein [Treponema sp.]
MSAKDEEFVNVVRNGKEFCYREAEPGRLLCRSCHSAVSEDMTRCSNCNNNLVEQTVSSSSYGNYDSYSSDSNYIPDEYAPISMWGYFGYELLFSIPILGWIFIIIKAVSADNENVKNFARSYFCIYIIILVIAVLVRCLI